MTVKTEVKNAHSEGCRRNQKNRPADLPRSAQRVPMCQLVDGAWLYL